MDNAGIGNENVETMMIGNNGLYCGIGGGAVCHVERRSFGLKAAIAHSVSGDL
jgi:hypothetical protein